MQTRKWSPSIWTIANVVFFVVAVLFFIYSNEQYITSRNKYLDEIATLKSQLERYQTRNEVTSVAVQTSAPTVPVEEPKSETLERGKKWVVTPSAEEEKAQQEFFEEYRILHSKIMDPSDTTVPKQYIIIHGSPSGLGNEIEAAISSIILGMITQRAVLISENLILEACSSTGNVNFDVPGSLFNQLNDYSSIFLSQIGGQDEIPTTKFYHTLGIELLLYISHLMDAACDDLRNNSLFSDFQVLRISSNQYYAALIINNPHYRDFFKQTFGKDVFGPVFRYFFKPKSELQRKIDGYLQNQFKGHYVIGIHMRQEYVRTRPYPLVMDVFFKCAEMNTPANVSAKYFIATDSGQYLQDAVDYFGKDKIIQGDGSPGLDLLLLGECDDMVVTTGSTFSDMAYARKSKLALKVSEVLMCFRDVTTQPCYFFYKAALGNAKCYPEDFYSPHLYYNPIFLNHRNCYHNFQWGPDHM